MARQVHKATNRSKVHAVHPFRSEVGGAIGLPFHQSWEAMVQQLHKLLGDLNTAHEREVMELRYKITELGGNADVNMPGESALTAKRGLKRSQTLQLRTSEVEGFIATGAESMPNSARSCATSSLGLALRKTRTSSKQARKVSDSGASQRQSMRSASANSGASIAWTRRASNGSLAYRAVNSEPRTTGLGEESTSPMSHKPNDSFGGATDASFPLARPSVAASYSEVGGSKMLSVVPEPPGPLPCMVQDCKEPSAVVLHETHEPPPLPIDRFSTTSRRGSAPALLIQGLLTRRRRSDPVPAKIVSIEASVPETASSDLTSEEEQDEQKADAMKIDPVVNEMEKRAISAPAIIPDPDGPEDKDADAEHPEHGQGCACGRPFFRNSTSPSGSRTLASLQGSQTMSGQERVLSFLSLGDRADPSLVGHRSSSQSVASSPSLKGAHLESWPAPLASILKDAYTCPCGKRLPGDAFMCHKCGRRKPQSLSRQFETQSSQERLCRESVREEPAVNDFWMETATKRLYGVAEDPYDHVDPHHRRVLTEMRELWETAVAPPRNSTEEDDGEEMQKKFSRTSTVKTIFRDVAHARSRANHAKTHNSLAEGLVIADDADKCSKTLQPFIAHPSSMWRLFWDVLGTLFLTCDLITIPLQAFGSYIDFEGPFLFTMALSTAVYWALDFLLSFMVGYHSKGRVVMVPWMIALHYLRTWFLLDAALVCIDWSFILLGQSNKASFMRIGKTMTRGMRVLRLVRVVKMQSLLLSFMERIQSEYVRTLCSILGLVVFIVVMNHYIACGWYGLQEWFDQSDSWVAYYFRPEDDLSYRYSTSLHWSLTQFTPASMEITPRNKTERAYNVVVLIFALVTFSSFVSSITQSMTHLRTINSRRMDQELKLRRYLNQHGISAQLVNRIWHYLYQRDVINSSRIRTKESEVLALDLLPASIIGDLRFEACSPVLVKHPLFSHYSTSEPLGLRQLCNQAVVEVSLLRNQELFSVTTGEAAQMFFIEEGVLEYALPCRCGVNDAWLEDDEDDGLGESRWDNCEKEIQGFDKIKVGEWACEAALWVEEVELFSSFIAEQGSELLVIDTEAFETVVARHEGSLGKMCRYAAAFVSSLQAECRWRACIHNNHEDVQALVVSDFCHSPRGTGRSNGRHSTGVSVSKKISTSPKSRTSVRQRASDSDSATTRW